MHRSIKTKSPRHSLFAVAGICALLTAIGCIGEPYEACPDDQRIMIDPADAQIWPPVVHTGFNSRDTFLAPVSTNFVPDEWTTGNQSIVSVAGYPICGTPSIYDPSGLVVAENPGLTTVTAHAPGIALSVDIRVEQYTEEETDIGEDRYEDDGVGDERRSCAGCHQEVNGVDHTPLEMAFHDDAAILAATKNSQYPDLCTDVDGNECQCGVAGCDNVSPGYILLGGDHAWDLTLEEERGIVAFMRSLRPRGI